MISRQLTQELLRANNTYAKKQKERKEGFNKVIKNTEKYTIIRRVGRLKKIKKIKKE